MRALRSVARACRSVLRSRSRRSLSSPERAVRPRRPRSRSSWSRASSRSRRRPGTPASAPTQPFLGHAFLAALEASGSACQETGWLPLHLVVERDGRLLGCAPMYLKSHSYGEYVFDWGWANAYERAGGRYYPKLQVAVPFTPVPGPRLLVRPGAAAGGAPALSSRAARRRRAARRLARCTSPSAARRNGTPSATAGLLRAPGVQYHWHNRGYRQLRRLPRQRSRAASARRSARSARGSPSRASCSRR